MNSLDEFGDISRKLGDDLAEANAESAKLIDEVLQELGLLQAMWMGEKPVNELPGGATDLILDCPPAEALSSLQVKWIAGLASFMDHPLTLQRFVQLGCRYSAIALALAEESAINIHQLHQLLDAALSQLPNPQWFLVVRRILWRVMRSAALPGVLNKIEQSEEADRLLARTGMSRRQAA